MPRKISPSSYFTHFIIDWVNPRAGLDAREKKIISSSAGNRTLVVELVA
jgi:hypothetical protein